jgi:glucosyl-3-phosphoglycerate synthase
MSTPAESEKRRCMGEPEADGTTVREWFERRSFHHLEFADLTHLADQKNRAGVCVTLILPTRNVADTIGNVLGQLEALTAAPARILDQIIVVDADSPDGTADIARSHGVEVYSENLLLPEYGKALGKGDAMWRSLTRARGDIIAFADADSKNFSTHFLVGILAPLLVEPELHFVKAAYRRPFSEGSQTRPLGGGRVTELTAKPLFNLFFPELAGFVQPLAGEFAATRELLFSIPFFTGYGVEAGLLIDAADAFGLKAMAQVDLGVRLNRHQSLSELGRMSYAILRTILHRAKPGELQHMSPYLHAVAETDGLHLNEYQEELTERPPMRNVLAAQPLP